MAERVITVKGTGRAFARPDEARIFWELSAQSLTYDEAAGQAAKRRDMLIASLAPLGVEAEEVKTAAFSIDAVYESERDSEGNYSNVFKGFRCVHRLRLAVPMDMKRLSEIMSAVSSCRAEPEVTLRFAVRDAESLSNEALRGAVKAARRKAELIAEASASRLGELISAEHFSQGADGGSPLEIQPRLARAMAAEIIVEPEEVEIAEAVSMTWEISSARLRINARRPIAP